MTGLDRDAIYLEVAQLAREVADRADSRSAWNYDTIETTALGAVFDAFSNFADLLESKVCK